MADRSKTIRDLIESEGSKLSTERISNLVGKISSVSTGSITASVIGSTSIASTSVIGAVLSHQESKSIEPTGQWKILQPHANEE